MFLQLNQEHFYAAIVFTVSVLRSLKVDPSSLLPIWKAEDKKWKLFPHVELFSVLMYKQSADGMDNNQIH